MDRRTRGKQSKADPNVSPTVNLAGLEFEAAVRATLATGKAPPPPKRPKRKGKK
jgi:hypothetical protein